MVLLRRPFLTLLLALVWMMLADAYTLPAFVSGLLAALVALLIFPEPSFPIPRVEFGGVAGFFRWLYKLIRLTVYFLWQVVLSVLMVARIVLSRQMAIKPGILSMELKARTPAQIATLATLITLTPGTVSIDVSPRHDVLYIHTIDASDPAETLRVPRRFEEMVMEVMP